jgi:hypothetical protein
MPVNDMIKFLISVRIFPKNQGSSGIFKIIIAKKS